MTTDYLDSNQEVALPWLRRVRLWKCALQVEEVFVRLAAV